MIILLILFIPVFLAFLVGVSSWHPVLGVALIYASANVKGSPIAVTTLGLAGIGIMIGWWFGFYGHGFDPWPFS